MVEKTSQTIAEICVHSAFIPFRRDRLSLKTIRLGARGTGFDPDFRPHLSLRYLRLLLFKIDSREKTLAFSLYPLAFPDMNIRDVSHDL